MKKNFQVNEVLTICVINVLIGLLFIFLPVDKIIAVLFVIFGILILLINLPIFIVSFLNVHKGNKYLTDTITYGISIILGLAMIFWQNEFFAIISALVLIVIPMVRIFMADFKKAQFRIELPKIVLGVLLIILGPWGLSNLVFDIFGYILVGFGVVFLLYFFLCQYRKKKKHKKDSNIIDAVFEEKK